ncbi:MAG TPA: hypothetical protein PK987_01805, partial [Ferruginibacter sp.]|nr:hypothetical protein [Ferruginibacter sp.]
MERVETLLKKLQEQFTNKATPGQLLLTVQMLQAELLHLQSNNASMFDNDVVAVTVSAMQVIAAPVEQVKINNDEEKTVEVLLVNEVELEAELEEIKRNADAMKKISVQNKPHIIFETEEDIPTLTHQQKPQVQATSDDKTKELNDAISDNHHTSLNERLKQSKIDLGDTLTEVPIRDLRKAIGVNDRFVFINELFRGDEAVY